MTRALQVTLILIIAGTITMIALFAGLDNAPNPEDIQKIRTHSISVGKNIAFLSFMALQQEGVYSPTIDQMEYKFDSVYVSKFGHSYKMEAK
jgi:hypothetical protein